MSIKTGHKTTWGKIVPRFASFHLKSSWKPKETERFFIAFTKPVKIVQIIKNTRNEAKFCLMRREVSKNKNESTYQSKFKFTEPKQKAFSFWSSRISYVETEKITPKLHMYVPKSRDKNDSQPREQLLSAPIVTTREKRIKYTYTFLGEMQRYNICHRANSKSIWRYFRIRRRYLYCIDVDIHLERFFVDAEYDEFAGSGNIARI